VVMFGGGSATIQNLSPSDITVRGNHIMRPASWKGVWQAKNLVESKHAKRLLIEGNVIEGIWQDAQAGFAFVLKSENQNGDNPWTQTADVTIRYNRIRNVGSVFNIAANPATYPAVSAARFVITDNVVDNVNVGPYIAEGRLFQFLAGLSDVVVMHNTMASANGGSSGTVVFDVPSTARLVMHSNILHHGVYGVKGSSTTEGTISLAKFAPGYLYTNNAMIAGGTASGYPANNYFAAQLSSLGFIDATNGDYRLTTSSAYRNKGYDGRDIGADVNTLNAKTSGVVVGP
jgi:Right handed beta helix region